MVDWNNLTAGQCWEALRSAPRVYGPWTRAGDKDDCYIRPTPDGSPSLVIVKRIMGSWYCYVGRSISLPSAFATYESAMDLVDKLLRTQGAKLVGGSRPLRRPELVADREDNERPTVPSATPKGEVLLAAGHR